MLTYFLLVSHHSFDCHGGCVTVDGARYGQIFETRNKDPAGAGACLNGFVLLGVGDLCHKLPVFFDVLKYPLFGLPLMDLCCLGVSIFHFAS